MINISQTLNDYLKAFTFRNNPNLRPVGMQIEYTDEMLDEYEKCKNDPVYFISTYVKVIHPDRGIVPMELFEYQKRMVRAYHENRRVIFLTARQQGKCLCINNKVKIRSKETGQIVELTLGELYEWQAFRQTFNDKAMQTLRNIVSGIQSGENMSDVQD